MAAWRGRKVAPIIYFSAAKKSLLHYASQRLSLVWRDLVAMVQGFGGDGKELIGLPDDEICIGTCNDGSFSWLQRDLPRRISTKPFRHVE